MADLEDAVAAVLQTDTVKAIIADRYYPVDLPQGPVWPAVTYMVVSNPRVYGFKRRLRWQRARVQFDAFAVTYDEAIALKKAVEDALDALVMAEVGGVMVQKVFVTMDRDGGDSGQRKSGGRVRHRILEATFIFKGT